MKHFISKTKTYSKQLHFQKLKTHRGIPLRLGLLTSECGSNQGKRVHWLTEKLEISWPAPAILDMFEAHFSDQNAPKLSGGWGQTRSKHFCAFSKPKLGRLSARVVI